MNRPVHRRRDFFLILAKGRETLSVYIIENGRGDGMPNFSLKESREKSRERISAAIPNGI